MEVIPLLITVALFACACVVVYYILAWMALGEPWALIFRVILGLAAIIIVLGFVTGKVPLLTLRL
jgi:hypothetical protein